MRPALVTLIFGLLLLIPATVGLFLTGVPTLLCPLPYLTVVPAFLLSGMHLERSVIAIPMIFFFAWNPSLFLGGSAIPKRTYILFVIATVMSVIWFIVGWKYGLEYQGPAYTHYICLLNIFWIAGIDILLLLRRRSNPSFASNIILHFVLFAWLGWYAFPYLGELP
jgi:hypothetical protein